MWLNNVLENTEYNIETYAIHKRVNVWIFQEKGHSLSLFSLIPSSQ
jgi:hypothetical protein